MSLTFQTPFVVSKFRAFVLFFLVALLGSCVTVNVPIVFPESSVQKATDDFVREIYRAKEKGKTPAASDQNPVKKEKNPQKTHIEFLFFNHAYAIEAVFKVDSTKAIKLQQNLSARVPEVIQQKRNGVLGEDSKGLLVIKTPEKLKDLLKRRIEKIVDEENSDREKLYEEVAKSNNVPGRLQDVKRSFARSFQAESPSGTWVQDNDGHWSQKP